jgi:hypothetical protein
VSRILSTFYLTLHDFRELTSYRPIAAVVGGFQAIPGRVMGHAGAWTGIAEGTAESKYKALESAGVTMVDHPAKFGGVMKDILAKSGRNVRKIVSSCFSCQYISILTPPGTIRSPTTPLISHLPPPNTLPTSSTSPAAKTLPPPLPFPVRRPPEIVRHLSLSFHPLQSLFNPLPWNHHLPHKP